MLHLAKLLFDGFDADGDGSLAVVEVSLESLLRPAFFKTLARELFELVDVNKDGFISAEDNLEFSLVMNMERNPTIIYGLLSVLDSDRDDRVVVVELEELMVRLHSFLRLIILLMVGGSVDSAVALLPQRGWTRLQRAPAYAGEELE